jgi:hypothetical protein
MKTSINLKRVLHAIIVVTVIISSVVITKNIVRNIKHLYGLEAAGKGVTCFFDMIQ